MNEFALIDRLTRGLPGNETVVVGSGDDCAVLDLGLPDRWVLFKTDAVVAGVHFTPEAAPAQVGHKALARGLSDIAAMAGTPVAALVTLALPPQFDAPWLEAVYAGMNALAKRHHVAMVGGETTANPDRVLISVSLVGTVEKNRCTLRSGAKPGDALMVTGELGGSLAGKHLEFEPRLEEARWLASHFAVHAMIDLSDGLAGDLRHLLRASGVGAELHAESVPVSQAARVKAAKGSPRQPPLHAALTDGEDFELLFTLPSREAVAVLDAWKEEFPKVRLTCIGKILSEPDLRIRDAQGVRPLTAHGYVHFDKS